MLASNIKYGFISYILYKTLKNDKVKETINKCKIYYTYRKWNGLL